MKFILLVMFLFSSFACSKKHEEQNLKYTLEEFNHLLDNSGAVPDKKVTSINFSDYGIGVGRTTSRAMEYQRLGFYAIEFETQSQAHSEAVRLNQYYSRNWLFDRTEGEPVLEDFVINTFGATNPNRRLQRKPKALPKVDKIDHSSGEAKAPAAH
jgi:hypothetical protein